MNVIQYIHIHTIELLLSNVGVARNRNCVMKFLIKMPFELDIVFLRARPSSIWMIDGYHSR